MTQDKKDTPFWAVMKHPSPGTYLTPSDDVTVGKAGADRQPSLSDGGANFPHLTPRQLPPAGILSGPVDSGDTELPPGCGRLDLSTGDEHY